MTLPVFPSEISIKDVQKEFQILVDPANPPQTGLGDLYIKNSGPVFPGNYGWPYGGNMAVIPSSGQISLSNFHQTTAYIPRWRLATLYAGSVARWTVPDTLISELQIFVIGGGGSGATWPSGAAGGAGGGGCFWQGNITPGTHIYYRAGAGGPSIFGDSTRYSHDAADSYFGVPGDPWYMSVPGLGTGGYNMSGSVRGPGTGSTGIGGTIQGKGGNGKPERTAGQAPQPTTLGGGGGACDRGDSSGSPGATRMSYYGSAIGGARGGNAREAGQWPGGGGGGDNSNRWARVGGDGAIFIVGVW